MFLFLKSFWLPTDAPTRDQPVAIVLLYEFGTCPKILICDRLPMARLFARELLIVQ